MLPQPFENALVLTGPTGSGKTALALELADQLGAEIISLDSMALYRGMDTITAKPTPEERARVPHHLVDVLDPWEDASVAWWLEQARHCCRDIETRGKKALFVGGTPLYLKALLCGIFDGPGSDPVVRGRLEAEATRDGGAVLHARLASVDAPTAARLHPNDVRRVVRALEVWEMTGKPISAWQGQWVDAEDASAPLDEACAPSCLHLDWPREELYRRINARVEHMFTHGLLEEVRQLRAQPRPLSRTASQALGFQEARRCLDGELTLNAAIAAVQMGTRRFAKRQLTWFRSLPTCRPTTPELTMALWGRRMV